MPRRTSDAVAAEPVEVAPDELLTAAIPIVRRGYAPDIVDGLLDRAATTIERLRTLDDGDLDARRREHADLLHRTLMLAEASADQRVAEAESLAATVLADARTRAGRLVAEAELAASQLVEAEQTRAELTVGEALSRRQLLQAEIGALEQYARDLRVRLRAVFDTHAAALDRVIATVSDDRPRLGEIDLTEPPLARIDDASSWRDEQGPTALLDVIEDDEATALVVEGNGRHA